MPRQRFPKAVRLRRRAEFARVFRDGGRARGSWMTVAVIENGTTTTRLGLSVGRAAWKRAVQRNRLRRLYREAFRLTRAVLPAGLDIVVIGSRPKASPPLAELETELVALARKASSRYRERAAERARAERSE